MDNIKKFEVGKTYSCVGLYGGEEVIRVVDRTDSTISFIYTDDGVKEVRTRLIIIQGAYNPNTGRTSGNRETIIAWEYTPCGGRYGDDERYGYFMA